MARALISLRGWQVFACLLGLVAGFVPGVSFTGPFWGLDFMSGGALAPDDVRASVIGVEAGSPAARAGFRAADIFLEPEDFDGVSAALDEVKRGKARAFRVERREKEVTVEAGPAAPELAAVWYASPWYPVAGALFLGLGLFVFATAALVPAPWWRTIPVTVAGLGIAAGFALALAEGSVFSRFRVYQRWPMGTGEEWSIHQGLIGITAGVLLAVFAAADIRQRLVGPPGATGPEK